MFFEDTINNPDGYTYSFWISRRFGLCTEPYADQSQPIAMDIAVVSSNSKSINVTDCSTNIMALKCKNTFSTNSGQGTVRNNLDFTLEKCDVEAIEKQQQ